MLIKEIFYSYQGEGPYVGYPQIFIRFFGCNIQCKYCDEPDLPSQKKQWSLDEALSIIKPLFTKPLHSVSITGGEPLLHIKSIQSLYPYLPFPLYLETNGLLPESLAIVQDMFTYFSVDFKSGYKEKFLQFMTLLLPKVILGANPTVFVKYVMSEYHIQDLTDLRESLSAIHPQLPCIIQPVTPYGEIKKGPTSEDIQNAYLFLSEKLTDIRVIGQTHKLIGVK